LFYDLDENERYIQQFDYSFVVLALLAFVPHNMFPFKRENLKTNLQRIIHNLLAVIVFLSLPTLVILFQTAINTEFWFLGISGLVIIGGTIGVTGISVIKNGVNGVTEMLIINGISIWSIFVTILTFIW